MDEKTLKNIKLYASYFVRIFAPAMTTLIASLGSVYQWDQVTNVIAVLGAVTTFIGTIAQIQSNANAKQAVEDAKENNSNEVK